jgi:purine-binding chemotaxis protein CheW
MTTHQFITFRIDEYLAGIDILRVREINRLVDITPVQHAPDYIRGLINLRGQTVTVFDLGIRLGLAPRKITEETHNIIIKSDSVGLLVDCIGDVVEAKSDEIKTPPANLGGITRKFIESVVKLEKELMIVLSSEKILEYQAIQKEGQP